MKPWLLVTDANSGFHPRGRLIRCLLRSFCEPAEAEFRARGKCVDFTVAAFAVGDRRGGVVVHPCAVEIGSQVVTLNRWIGEPIPESQRQEKHPGKGQPHEGDQPRKPSGKLHRPHKFFCSRFLTPGRRNSGAACGHFGLLGVGGLADFEHRFGEQLLAFSRRLGSRTEAIQEQVPCRRKLGQDQLDRLRKGRSGLGFRVGNRKAFVLLSVKFAQGT